MGVPLGIVELGEQMNILCRLKIHNFYSWWDSKRQLNVRICFDCGKAQFLTLGAYRQLFWIDENKTEIK